MRQKETTVHRNYRVREFADLGGVTVKALRHYDRLGLLTPARTSAGHRVYTTNDLERLRRILALKRVGVALRQMRALLDADSQTLLTHLCASREVLSRARERLVRADRAIALVEESLRHTPADSSGLSRLADVLDVERDIAQMRRYFSDETWESAKRFYENWPTGKWIDLCRDVTAAASDRSGSARAEDLVRRWNTLAESFWREVPPDAGLYRKLHEGFARAWRDRENWSDTLKRRFADYRMDEVASYIGRASSVVNPPRV